MPKEVLQNSLRFLILHLLQLYGKKTPVERSFMWILLKFSEYLYKRKPPDGYFFLLWCADDDDDIYLTIYTNDDFWPIFI